MLKNGILWLVFSCLVLAGCKNTEKSNDTGRWREGILTDEFIFTEAPFKSCHASTIVETPTGIVAAWFGGDEEGATNVDIWVSRKVDGKWTNPEAVANGILSDTLRYPCWNPVLYQVPDGALQLY